MRPDRLICLNLVSTGFSLCYEMNNCSILKSPSKGYNVLNDQDTLCLSWNHRVLYHVHMSPALDLQINTYCTLTAQRFVTCLHWHYTWPALQTHLHVLLHNFSHIFFSHWDWTVHAKITERSLIGCPPPHLPPGITLPPPVYVPTIPSSHLAILFMWIFIMATML